MNLDVRNLVLEVGASESAADVQARLDEAAKDGFFLVNVVGRLAFLRTTVTQKKPKPEHIAGGPKSNRDGHDDAAHAIIKVNSTLTIQALIKLLTESGIKRGKTWVCEARMKQRSVPGV